MIGDSNAHHRRSIRLRDYDYSKNGAYFITICAQNRQQVFGEIGNGKMELNEYGKIVDDCLLKIETLYDHVEVKNRVVMPNHVHFIIEFKGATYDTNQNTARPSMQERSKMQLPKVVQQFKTATIKLCKNTDAGREGQRPHGMRALQWQRNYYDHIIRNEAEYLKIWEYIDTNPLKWQDDCYYEGGNL